MSDSKLLLHILRTVRDTKQIRTYGICGEVQKRLKKWYMVGHGFSSNAPFYKERCNAVVRLQSALYKLTKTWPNGGVDEDDRYPVEGNEHRFGEALEAGTLWDNPLRHELLDWLIKELENDAKPDSQHSNSSGER